MKIYTRTGDTGMTSLVGGSRLPKDHVRIEAYGTVDELNAHIGLLAASPQCPEALKSRLIFIQNKLFNIGAYLANPNPEGLEPIKIADTERLESSMDEMDRQLPPVNRFTLPGGSILSAQAHVARTVARRAERRIITLTAEAKVNQQVMSFINRLSDWLYVFSRYINQISDTQEAFWEQNL